MSFDLTTGEDVDSRAEWQKHWRGMPEFSQEIEKEFGMVIVRFETEADFKDFQKMIGQEINFVPGKTKSIWHPKNHVEGFLERFM